MTSNLRHPMSLRHLMSIQQDTRDKTVSHFWIVSYYTDIICLMSMSIVCFIIQTRDVYVDSVSHHTDTRCNVSYHTDTIRLVSHMCDETHYWHRNMSKHTDKFVLSHRHNTSCPTYVCVTSYVCVMRHIRLCAQTHVYVNSVSHHKDTRCLCQ